MGADRQAGRVLCREGIAGVGRRSGGGCSRRQVKSRVEGAVKEIPWRGRAQGWDGTAVGGQRRGMPHTCSVDMPRAAITRRSTMNEEK